MDLTGHGVTEPDSRRPVCPLPDLLGEDEHCGVHERGATRVVRALPRASGSTGGVTSPLASDIEEHGCSPGSLPVFLASLGGREAMRRSFNKEPTQFL